MKKSMNSLKAFLAIICCWAVLVSSVACKKMNERETDGDTEKTNEAIGSDKAENESKTGENSEKTENTNVNKKSIKILAIGNSFSIDAMEYLWDIFKNVGYDEVKLGNLYIGGCSLDTHWSNIENASMSYVYNQNVDGQWKGKSESINNILPSEDWEVITIQQVSQEAGLPSAYGNFENIVEYIVENKPDNAKIYWHMTWAYQSDSTHWGFPNYDRNQMIMYDAIVDTVNDVVLKNEAIDGVIPSGTAIQNIRTSYLGDTLTRDGFHMSYDYGRYVTALTWFSYISGEDCSAVDWVPSQYFYLTLHRSAINEAVNNAVRTPYSVTTSEYSEYS